MSLQSRAQLAEHEDETAGGAAQVLVHQLPIQVFQTASHKKLKKKNL